MNKGKAVFVTVIIAAMLVVIDIGLYILCTPGFIVLTGTLALYGYFRGAGVFRRWLAKDEAPAMKPVNVPQEWEKEDIPRPRRSQKPEIYDVTILDEVPSYRT